MAIDTAPSATKPSAGPTSARRSTPPRQTSTAESAKQQVPTLIQDTPQQTKESTPKLRKRSWEILAQTTIDDIRGMVTRTNLDGGVETATAARRAAAEQVDRQLKSAEKYLDMMANPITAARGTRIEGAWSHIHNARVTAVEVMDGDRLEAYVPEVLALAEKNLKRGGAPFDEAALAAIKKWHDERTKKRTRVAITDVHKHAIANVLRDSYDRVENEYHRLRRFQATVLAATIAVLLLVGGLIVLGYNNAQGVPLCFPDPSATVSQPVADTPPACPSGLHTEPGRDDVAVVALFGLLGATLAGVALVIRPAAPSPVPMAATRSFQVLLKAATGMLTAILGLLFLRAGVVPGFTQVDTQSQILVYAFVFGASQELITRLVDQRSNHLLAAVTSTEPTPNESRRSMRER